LICDLCKQNRRIEGELYEKIEMGKVRYISPAEWRKIMDEVPTIRSRAELQAILEKVSHWNENESREKLEKQKLLRRAAALGTLGQHPRAQQDRQRMIELTENPCRHKQAAALAWDWRQP